MLRLARSTGLDRPKTAGVYFAHVLFHRKLFQDSVVVRNDRSKSPPLGNRGTFTWQPKIDIRAAKIEVYQFAADGQTTVPARTCNR